MRYGLRALALSGAWLLASGCADTGGDEVGKRTDGGALDAQLTWCDVEPILQAHCQRCHTDPQENGAPFPLLSYADTQEGTPTHRFEQMGAAVERDFMPPQWLEVDPPVEPLPCSEKATLLAWIDQGAAPPPEDDASCLATSPTLLACP